MIALKYKKGFLGGHVTYMQGLVSGVISSVFVALLSPMSQSITSYVIIPEYFPNVIKRSGELGDFNPLAKAVSNFNDSKAL
ncbi:MAG: DUF4199 domain-containing protein [Cyclobacteriaceae bacterium]